MNVAVRPGSRVQDGKLQGVEGHAGVTVRKGYQAHHRLDVHLDVVPTESPFWIPERPLNDLQQGILRERLQYDDQRSGEQRADHFEGGILRGSTDEYHRTRLDVRKKGILLGLVETMDLIHEQDRALALDDPTLLSDLDHPAQLREPAGDGREGLEVGLGMRGDQAGEQLSFLSSALSYFSAPRGPMFHYRIQNDQQFPHAGRQRDLLRLPGSAQALVERA